MLGRKRFKKEIPVPLTPGDLMNKSIGPCAIFDRSPKSAPPVYGYSLNGETRDGSKFECLSPHSNSCHSLGNNFFFSRPNSPYNQNFSQSVSNSDFFEYALKQIKNSEVVGRLDRVKNVGSGKHRSILERKHSNTPRNFYPFGTPPRDGHKPFEMFVPRSPDQPHSFAGYSKLLYSGYPKILAAKRLQDLNVLGTNDHLESLFTTPTKKNEPSTGKRSTHKEQAIGSGSTLSSRTVKDDTLANANSPIIDFFEKKETKSVSKTAKLSGKHQGQLESSQHKKNELGDAEKRLQMILALDRATSLVKREKSMTLLSPPTLSDIDRGKEEISGSDMFTERGFSKSELEKSTVGTDIVNPKENQDSLFPAKPSTVVNNDISSASAAQSSPAKQDDLIKAEKRMQTFLMAKSAQATPTTSASALNKFTYGKSTKADEVHITSEYIETLKVVSNELPTPSVMYQLNKNTTDDNKKPEIEDSLMCSPVKDDEFADAHRRMMEFLKTKRNTNGGKTFQTSSTGNEVTTVTAPTSQEAAVVQSKKNSEQAQLDQAKDSELEEAAKRMQKFLASKQTVPPVTVNINEASSAQSQTSKTGTGLTETGDSERQNSLTAAGTSLRENNTIMMNNKVTSETSGAIGDASLKTVLSVSAEISLCGNNRKTAIIQGTFRTSPAKKDAILEAEKRMQTFLAAKQAKSADKKFPEQATGDMVRNTGTSISQRTDRIPECNQKQPQVNKGVDMDGVDNTAKLVKQNINVTKHIPTKPDPTEPATVDKVIKPNTQLESVIALPDTAKTEVELAKITDNKPNCSLAPVGTSLGGSYQRTATIEGTTQTSPAKEDAILEAEKRMQAFLALKQVKSADMNLRESTKLAVENSPVDKAETSAKRLDTTVTVKNKSLLPLVSDHFDENTTAEGKNPEIEDSLLCSPVKDDEFANAHRRMMEFLKTKGHKNPVKTFQTSSNQAVNLDDVDNTAKQEPCKTTSVTYAPLVALNQQEINSNQRKLNQAEDSELEEASKRMQAFLASQQATPVSEQDINVTKLIPPKAGHTEPAIVDTVIKVNKQMESVTAQPPTAKTENKLAMITDNKTRGSFSLAGKSQNGSDQKTAIIQGTSRTSPAKEDAIVEAEKRMQAFLALKQVKSADMNLLESTKLPINSLPADKAEKSAKLLDTRMTVKTDLSLSLVLDHNNENLTVEGKKLKIKDSLLCSPVKDDEFADAHRRMMEFLKAKGTKKLRKRFKLVQLETSPAKEDAIFKAEKRMQTFLAAKQSKSANIKLTVPTTEDLIRNTETRISQQTYRFSDCNPKQLKGNQCENVDDVDSTAKQEPCETRNVTSAPLTAISLQGSNARRLNQAEDSELAEAAKRMQAFLSSKQATPVVTRNIIVAASAQSQTCSVITEIQLDKAEKSAKLLDTEVTTSTAKITKIETANKNMTEFLAKKETAAKVTPIAVVTGIMPKSCSTPPAMIPIAPTLPNPVPLLEAVKNPTISTPEKLKTIVAEENDQMTPIGKGESERDARVSTPTRFISSPELSIPSTPIQSPENPVAAEIEVKPVVVVQPPPPPIVMPGDPMWLAQQMAMLFGHPMLIQPCIEEKPKVVETVVPRLSLPVNCEAVSNALTEMEVTKRLNETQSHSSCQLTIHHSTPKKSCLRKPDLFDNVPDYISHAKTPCQTPMKLQFEKKTRPPKPIYNRRERLRRQPINLIFPGRAKKSVKFQCDANLISKEPTYDEVVNGGGSGFKILSIVDYNTNTVCYPKYIPPSDFCRK